MIKSEELNIARTILLDNWWYKLKPELIIIEQFDYFIKKDIPIIQSAVLASCVNFNYAENLISDVERRREELLQLYEKIRATSLDSPLEAVYTTKNWIDNKETVLSFYAFLEMSARACRDLEEKLDN